MEDQKKVNLKGDTKRLGAYACALKAGSTSALAYGTESIEERHSHSYEFNNAYMAQFEAAGMEAVGINPATGLVEVMELKGHRWFVGTHFLPQYKSTAAKPAPLFVSFVRAAMEYQGSKKQK